VVRRRPVSLALVGVFVWVTGCTSYKQIELGEVAHHGNARVTTTDGKTRDFYEPRVEADSIAGRLSRDSQLIYAVPLDRVAEVEVKGTNVMATTGLVLLVVAIPVAIALISYGVAANEPGY